jgi:regulator of sigma E protease
VIGWFFGNIQISAVEPNQPAQKAGMRVGDVILSINGKQVLSRNSVRDYVASSEGKPIDVEVRRESAPLHFTLTPARISDDRYRIGVAYTEVALSPMKSVKLPFTEALSQSLLTNRENTRYLFATLRGIVQRRVSPKMMSGPVGIAKASAEEFGRGTWDYLNFMSTVSLSLAIFNLLPIPILDGGTLLLLFIEMLLQREVSMQVKETALKLGLVFLMMVVVFVFYNDLTRPA